MEVVYPGERGAFAEDAAQAIVGAGGRCTPVESVARAFAIAAEGGLAVVPLRSSLAGPVPLVEELLARAPVRVVAEHTLRVHLAVLGVKGASLAGLATVASHPIALAQCSQFFAAHANLKKAQTTSTAAAVRDIVASADPSFAALGSTRAAELWGATVLLEGVEDPPGSFTRFVVLGPLRARW